MNVQESEVKNRSVIKQRFIYLDSSNFLQMIRYNSIEELCKNEIDFVCHSRDFYCMLTILTIQSSFQLELKLK